MPRLVNENLRNFQVPQESITVSRILRGLFAISRNKVFSQDPQLKEWYISATLLLLFASVGTVGA